MLGNRSLDGGAESSAPAPVPAGTIGAEGSAAIHVSAVPRPGGSPVMSVFDSSNLLQGNEDGALRLRRFLRDHLMDFVMPFWLRHSIDPAGGVNTCIGDDGSLISRDKFGWSQWRAVWVFSKLHNDVDPGGPWLEFARQVFRFMTANGWDRKTEGWVFRLNHEGGVIEGCTSISTDAFAVYGLGEFARATGDEEAMGWATKTAESAMRRLRQAHDRIPMAPYGVPEGGRAHGLLMTFSLALCELGVLLDERRYLQAAANMSDEIFTRFYRPDRDLLLERVSVDGLEFPPPLGTAVVPGHVIESMWFQIHIARALAQKGIRRAGDRVSQACGIMRRHLEIGWDEVYGGIHLAVDADGGAEVAWNFADTKLWWPHTEALYGLLLAYEESGESWCLEWYRRVHDYSFARFPVPEHGEWTQKLDRQGRPLHETVALPVKDPFHLPRALILSLEVLSRLEGVNGQGNGHVPGNGETNITE